MMRGNFSLSATVSGYCLLCLQSTVERSGSVILSAREREREVVLTPSIKEMNVDQEVEIPVTTVETVITTTSEDVPIIETTLEEVGYTVTPHND